MLSTLFNTIQTTLLGSRGFLLTSLLPVFLFAAGSAWFYSQLRPEAAAWFTALAAQNPTVSGATAFIVLLSVAYMFSSLNTLLRELLEGKLFEFGIGEPLRDAFLSRQLQEMGEARSTFERTQEQYHTLSQHNWDETLRTAREEGKSKAAPALAALAGVKATIDAFREKRRQLLDLDMEDVGSAVDELAKILRAHTAHDRKDDASRVLNDLHAELYLTIQYCHSRLQTRRIDAYWKVAAFPENVAPTRLGNIAGTMRSYAQSRYGMALEVFWARLQKVIQTDEKLFGTLQDAKIQLDFFVSMTWLGASFVIVWLAALVAASTDVALFLFTAVFGPLVVRACYLMACQSYLAFSESVRSAIDLKRFELIDAYHLPLPATSADERRLWEGLANWVGYGSPKGNTFFKHK